MATIRKGEKITDKIREINEEKQEAAEATIQEELELFIPPESLTTFTGKKLKWPVVTWSKEVRVLRLLGDVIDRVPELTDADYEDFSAGHIVKIFGAIMQRVPEHITEAVCILTDKEEEWVMNNMDSSDIVSLLYPFFLERKQMIMTALSVTK